MHNKSTIRVLHAHCTNHLFLSQCYSQGLDSDIAVAVGEAASPNDVPVIDAPIDLNTPAGCSIVVEGMVVTNVPASQLSKVKNMVRFFETLGEGPQEGSAPAQHEEVEVPASACAQRESDTTSTTATTGDDVDDVPNTPNIPPAGTQSPEVLFNGVDTYVDMPQENNDPETPPTQVVVNGNGARAHAIASHPIAITPSSLQTTTSGQAASPVASVGVVTPLSVGALYGKTGEEIRQEVRARLQRLKSDLQAAQSKLKNVDRVRLFVCNVTALLHCVSLSSNCFISLHYNLLRFTAGFGCVLYPSSQLGSQGSCI